MKNVLVTGAKGFLGRNLVAHPVRRNDIQVFPQDLENSETGLRNWLNRADVIFHLILSYPNYVCRVVWHKTFAPQEPRIDSGGGERREA